MMKNTYGFVAVLSLSQLLSLVQGKNLLAYDNSTIIFAEGYF